MSSQSAQPDPSIFDFDQNITGWNDDTPNLYIERLRRLCQTLPLNTALRAYVQLVFEKMVDPAIALVDDGTGKPLMLEVQHGGPTVLITDLFNALGWLISVLEVGVARPSSRLPDLFMLSIRFARLCNLLSKKTRSAVRGPAMAGIMWLTELGGGAAEIENASSAILESNTLVLGTSIPGGKSERLKKFQTSAQEAQGRMIFSVLGVWGLNDRKDSNPLGNCAESRGFVTFNDRKYLLNSIAVRIYMVNDKWSREGLSNEKRLFANACKTCVRVVLQSKLPFRDLVLERKGRPSFFVLDDRTSLKQVRDWEKEFGFEKGTLREISEAELAAFQEQADTHGGDDDDSDDDLADRIARLDVTNKNLTSSYGNDGRAAHSGGSQSGRQDFETSQAPSGVSARGPSHSGSSNREQRSGPERSRTGQTPQRKDKSTIPSRNHPQSSVDPRLTGSSASSNLASSSHSRTHAETSYDYSGTDYARSSQDSSLLSYSSTQKQRYQSSQTAPALGYYPRDSAPQPPVLRSDRSSVQPQSYSHSGQATNRYDVRYSGGPVVSSTSSSHDSHGSESSRMLEQRGPFDTSQPDMSGGAALSRREDDNFYAGQRDNSYGDSYRSNLQPSGYTPAPPVPQNYSASAQSVQGSYAPMVQSQGPGPNVYGWSPPGPGYLGPNQYPDPNQYPGPNQYLQATTSGANLYGPNAMAPAGPSPYAVNPSFLNPEQQRQQPPGPPGPSFVPPSQYDTGSVPGPGFYPGSSQGDPRRQGREGGGSGYRQGY
ncbi:unnamed protein product [Somion occarium]|uniref:Uncharacterized protein n=1 Tax=Somion occarium TaxID=3059160 RepID=A0ABP1CXE3_9APHY